jgi:hypothetical protein
VFFEERFGGGHGGADEKKRGEEDEGAFHEM